MTVATLMADPAFTEELVVVKTLRAENKWLSDNYLILKTMMAQVGVKASPRKRAAPNRGRSGSSTTSKPRKKSAAQRAKPSEPNSSFRQGYNEMRG